MTTVYANKSAIDIINSEFPRGLDPGNPHSTNSPKLPPVDMNLTVKA